MSAINEVLADIQSKINVPKNQRNEFGKYNYRSLEDILMALKPLLAAHAATVLISDDIVLVGDRYYVKSTATLVVGGDDISCTGWAREADDRKGMDASQVTGSTSSYARKYAMNGLFAIDDNKDAEATNTHDKETAKKATKPQPKPTPPPSNMATDQQLKDMAALMESLGLTTREQRQTCVNGWLKSKELAPVNLSKELTKQQATDLTKSLKDELAALSGDNGQDETGGE